MESIFEFILIGLALALIAFKNNIKVFQALLTLSGVILLLNLFQGFDADPSVGMMRIAMIATLLLGLLVSYLPELWLKRGAILVVSLPTLIPIGAKATFQDFEVIWDVKLFLLVAFGSLIPLIVWIKQVVGERWFSIDTSIYNKAVKVILLGFLTFGAMFLFSTFGLIALAVGVLAAGLASKDKDLTAIGSAMAGISWVVVQTTGIPDFDFVFLKGNFWMGLVTGFGLFLLNRSGKNAPLLISYLIPLVIGFLFIALGKINPNFGGLPTLIGIILGLSLAFVADITDNHKSLKALPLLFVFIGMTSLTTNLLKQEELKVETLIEKPASVEAVAEQDIFEMDVIPLAASEQGVWKSVQDNSKLTFELGPKGSRTSGAIKKFDVQATFGASGDLADIQVKMDAESLTTFDAIRDESVLSEEFIHTEKYPAIVYTSKSVTKKGENFVVEGELNFMGIKQAVNLEVRFVSKVTKGGKNYLVFVGKSGVDRVAHGMTSDPKIGNFVDIEFEVALSK